MLPYSYITEGEYDFYLFLQLLHNSPNLIVRIDYDTKHSAWLADFIIWKHKSIVRQLSLF